MIVVSGCPRSGTSMMMRIMSAALGEDRILGNEKEKNVKREKIEERRKSQVDKLTGIKKYLFNRRRNDDSRTVDQVERAKDMNPNGYYEMEFCCNGIKYSPKRESILEDDKVCKPTEQMVVKVVSQGLASSDPTHVSKIVFMSRNPRSVAKSQERLGRQNPMSPEQAPEVAGSKVLIRSVEMYVNVTAGAARWINDHLEILVLIVDYDRMISDAATVLGEVKDFLGEGDFESAVSMIDPSLKRSEPADDVGDDWDLADGIYGMVNNENWMSIIDAVKAESAKPKHPSQWKCMRLRSVVTKEICELCKTHQQTTGNLIANAERKRIKWEQEPCVYECGIAGPAEKTVEESIAGNHWSVLLQSAQESQSGPTDPVLDNG